MSHQQKPSPDVADSLRQLGFSAFRPGQQEVVERLLTHGAALAVFPTGGGKSLCYQLPALLCEGVTLVVSPLIALMKDQIDFLHRRGIAAARLDSSQSAEQAREINARLEAGALKLLYVAPERFNNERFRARLRQTRVALFAVDEAHCISEWGHNFRPDYLKLARAAQELGAERVLALTATATPQVVADICAGFAIPGDCAIVTGFYRPNLALSVVPVQAAERDDFLARRLGSRRPGATIVYVTLQKTAERVADGLTRAGLSARAYHAGMDDQDRAAVQDWWMAAGDGIVVATIAFGMGIDKADVRSVYHYNLPKSLESYSQEIGRAGRDGLPATVEMLACWDDVATLENFAFGDTPTEDSLRSLMDELLSLGPAFDVSPGDLAGRHDLRPLVLQTALTYLELRGVLHQETPFYAGYEVRPRVPLPDILAHFQPPHAAFVQSLFDQARRGRIWYRLNPDEAADALGQPRPRIVRALEYLEEHDLTEMRASDLRQRYTRPAGSDGDPAALAAELAERFAGREQQETARLQRVLDFIEHDGCLVNALVGYFGERRDAPCGHCTHCATGRPVRPAPQEARAPLAEAVDAVAVQALRAAHPAALGQPRQIARFLCGLTSPALLRARLSRHPLFGALASYRFKEVLAWCL